MTLPDLRKVLVIHRMIKPDEWDNGFFVQADDRIISADYRRAHDGQTTGYMDVWIERRVSDE